MIKSFQIQEDIFIARRKLSPERKAFINGTFIIPQYKYLKDLLTEYVNLYGKDKWTLSTYSRNCSLIKNYIKPLIGDIKTLRD